MADLKLKHLRSDLSVCGDLDCPAVRRDLARHIAASDALADPQVRAAIDAALRTLGDHPADQIGIHNARMMDPTLVGRCIECRADISDNAIFCSGACADRMRDRNAKREKLIGAIVDAIGPRVLPRCEKCGEPFIPRRSDARYCSPKCGAATRMKGFRSREQREYEAAEQETREVEAQARNRCATAAQQLERHVAGCAVCTKGVRAYDLCDVGQGLLEEAARTPGTYTRESIGTTRDYAAFRESPDENDSP